MRTSARSVALVLFDEVEILDFAGAVQALTLAGRHWNWRPFKIMALADKPRLVTTQNQLKLEAPFAYADCPKPELIFIAGGYGARVAANDPNLLSWLRAAWSKETVACTVGHGSLLLARAGLLENETISAAPNTEKLLRELEPNPNFTIDNVSRLSIGRQVLSARSSEASVELGLILVERFLGLSSRQRVATELGMPAPVAVSTFDLGNDGSLPTEIAADGENSNDDPS